MLRINSAQTFSFQNIPTRSTKTSGTSNANTPPRSFANSRIPAKSEIKSEETSTGEMKKLLHLTNKIGKELYGKVDRETFSKIFETITKAFHANGMSLEGLDINPEDIIENPQNEIIIPINLNNAMLDRLNNIAKESELAGSNIKFEYIDKILDEHRKSIDTVA